MTIENEQFRNLYVYFPQLLKTMKTTQREGRARKTHPEYNILIITIFPLDPLYDAKY